ncbi:MAG: hypothetical protein ACE5K8_03740 [Candidatus Zixiibacteriota bacterium]
MPRPRLVFFNGYCTSCLIVGLIFLLSLSCGKPPVVDYREIRDRGYEIAWVEPQIIISDSLFTLIRSERIDSFRVDQTTDIGEAESPSLMFHVDHYECFTSVNLLAATGELIKPLLVRKLRPGYYKLTVDFSHLSRELYPFDNFLLKADYCGTSVSWPIHR